MEYDEALLKQEQQLFTRLAKRRKLYLFLWYLSLPAAAAMVFCASFFPRSSLVWLADMLHMPHAISSAEVASFVFFAVIVALALFFTPLIRYQGGLRAEYSLERLITLRLVSMLGHWSLASTGTSLRPFITQSKLFPANVSIGERAGVKARVGQHMFTVQEMVITHAGECLFAGLAIHCTATDRASYARGQMHGVERITTPPEWDITPGLAVWPQRAVPWDTALLHRLSAGLGVWRERIASRAERPALEAEREYEAQFSEVPDMVRAWQSPCAEFRAVRINDAWLFLFPCAAQPFAAESLFIPSWERKAAILHYLKPWMEALSPELNRP